MTVHQCYLRYQLDDLALRELAEHLAVLVDAEDAVLTSASPVLVTVCYRLLGRLRVRVPEPEPVGRRARVVRHLLG